MPSSTIVDNKRIKSRNKWHMSNIHSMNCVEIPHFDTSKGKISIDY